MPLLQKLIRITAFLILVVLASLTIIASGGGGDGSGLTNNGTNTDLNFNWGTAEEITGTTGLSITSAFYDQEGNIFISLTNGQLQYTVKYTSNPGWNLPEQIQYPDSGHIYERKFIIGSDNTLMAVVIVSEELRTIKHVAASRYNPDEGWSNGARIEDFNDISSVALRIGSDASGRIMVVWKNEGADYNLWSRIYNADIETWGQVESVENLSGNITGHYLQVRSTGDALVFWELEDKLYINYHSASSGWGSPDQINIREAVENVEALAFLADSNSNIYPVWVMDSEICIRKISNSNILASPECADLGAFSISGYGPYSIAADSRGNIIVVWYKLGEDEYYNLWSILYSVDSGWQIPVSMEDHSGNVSRPKVAFDSAGNAIVTWGNSLHGKQSVWVKRYVKDSGWTAAEMLWVSGENIGNDPDTKIYFGPSNNAFVTWHESTYIAGPIYDYFNVWLARYNSDSGWDSPTILDNGDKASSPHMAIDSAGRAVVVWQQDNKVWVNFYR